MEDVQVHTTSEVSGTRALAEGAACFLSPIVFAACRSRPGGRHIRALADGPCSSRNCQTWGRPAVVLSSETLWRSLRLGVMTRR